MKSKFRALASPRFVLHIFRSTIILFYPAVHCIFPLSLITVPIHLSFSSPVCPLKHFSLLTISCSCSIHAADVTSPFQNSQFSMYCQVHVRIIQTTTVVIRLSTNHFPVLTQFIPAVLLIQYTAQYTVTHTIYRVSQEEWTKLREGVP